MDYIRDQTIHDFEAMLSKELSVCSDRFLSWVSKAALPMWWKHGADPHGGFFERLDQDGHPMMFDVRRARVQPRQVYCYAQATKIGWDGPSQYPITHGLSWFEKTFQREDGFFGSSVSFEGKLVDPSIDLYDQAFALLGYASAAEAIPQRALEFQYTSINLYERVKKSYAHPIAGFRQATASKAPMCTNPHMHLFEAALAWEEVPNSAPCWSNLADELARLALDILFDPSSGIIHEYYDDDWRPMQEKALRVFQPGHQFEWAWLLCIWSERRKNDQALVVAKKLFDAGENYGICQNRKVAVMSVNDDFTADDNLARLWAQTEWLKSALRLCSYSRGAERCNYLQSALKAYEALMKFIPDQTKGLWFDKLDSRNALVDEPAPASSFYHIITAALELKLTLND